jgi:histidine kinase
MRELLAKRDRSTLFVDPDWPGGKVVLKVLDDEFPALDLLARFINELTLTRDLNIRGLRRALERTRIDNRHALVLQHFDGQSLGNMPIVHDRSQLVEFLSVAVQLAHTLGELHAAGVLHRDIKPSNILVNAQLQTCIIDFGLATRLHLKVAEQDTSRLVGTMAYISPEQTGRMNRSVDHRSDLYSLGAAFYEVLTGRPPFEARDALEMVHCHLAIKPRPPHELNTAIPRSISHIVEKLLEKDPEDRYRSAFGLEADLADCLRAARESAEDFSLTLGKHDAPPRFAIPERLYGRKKEVRELIGLLAPQHHGAPQVVTVVGASGVGKSALVGELQRPLAATRGTLARGKFDQLSRAVPYVAVTQALTALIDGLLTADEDQLHVWQVRLRDAVGELGRAVLPVVPNLELVLGPQPAVPHLDGAAAQNRLRYVLRRLVRAVCTPEHPVALFLDDMQWADLASLDVLESLLTDPDVRYLMIILAWRDGEVGPTHAVTEMLRTLATRGLQTRNVTLGPLQPEHVAELVADATHGSEAECTALARLLHEKTGGNAFFVRRFLEHLAERGLLEWDGPRGAWHWQLSQIAATQVTDNVVQLLTGKLLELPPDARRTVHVAACLGHRFSLATLAAVAEQSEAEVAEAILPVLQAGLVSPLGEGWMQVSAAKELATEVGVEFAFAHDRIQAAAYALGTDAERQLLHARIASRLLATGNAADAIERVFEVARHVAAAEPVAPGSPEALQRARTHDLAARRALEGGAFALAGEQADFGIRHLTEQTWSDDHALAMSLYQTSVQVGAQCMDPARTAAGSEEVLRFATSALDRARVRAARAMVAMAREDMAGALEIGVAALDELGVRFPRHPRPPHIILALLRVRRTLAGRVEVLANLPPLEDPQILAALELMERLMPCAFRSGSHLFPLFVFEMVRLSVLHGNSRFAAMGFASYAIAQCAVLGDYNLGYRFAGMANVVGEKYRSVGNLFIFDIFIRHWKSPLAESVAGLGRTFRVGMERGDMYQATWGACYQGLFAFTSGAPLASVRELYDSYTEALRWDEGCDGMRRMVTQMVVNLTEPVPLPHRLDGEHYTSEWVKKRWAERHDTTEIGHYHNFSMMLCVIFDEIPEALTHATEAEKYADGLNPMYFWPMLHFNASIARTQSLRKNPRQAGLKRAVNKSLAKLKKWAAQNPTNYEHMWQTVAAELAAVSGDVAKAQKHFDAAIQAARTHSAPLHQLALILQLAAKFLETRGQTVLAQMLMQQSVHAWSEWGATVLVRRVTAQNPHLAGTERGTERLRIGASSATSSDSRVTALDFQAVMKASAAISAEIVMERLTERLVRIMAQHAGAQAGALLLRRDGVLRVDVELDHDTVRATPGMAPERSRVVCAPIVQYVARTLEPLVLADASADPRFEGGAQVKERGVRSVLCAPIVRQGRLDAVVYFENNVTVGAFTPDRLEVLTLLSTQAGTAIENADLYRNLEEKVRERTAELEKQRAQLADEKAKSEELLLNILPIETARELKATGRTRARRFEGVSVLFADIAGFTAAAARMSPEELVSELDECFRAFDDICQRLGLEKIKTIGDAYMAAGGVPEPSRGSPVDVVRAGLELQEFMIARANAGASAPFRVRVGIHTGPVVAGVVGSRKFAWDIWGDTVNTAARMEQAGQVDRVNVSATTWNLVSAHFACTPRGAIFAKNLGELEMFFVDGEQDGASLPVPVLTA